MPTCSKFGLKIPQFLTTFQALLCLLSAALPLDPTRPVGCHRLWSAAPYWLPGPTDWQPWALRKSQRLWGVSWLWSTVNMEEFFWGRPVSSRYIDRSLFFFHWLGLLGQGWWKELKQQQQQRCQTLINRLASHVYSLYVHSTDKQSCMEKERKSERPWSISLSELILMQQQKSRIPERD